MTITPKELGTWTKDTYLTRSHRVEFPERQLGRFLKSLSVRKPEGPKQGKGA